ncbi:Ig-like domain-containing protein [Ferruginibacter yonginensis]|uniref:Ig-like domain-containing protein n=1 Tax=Ferruginibacter yonginensis TaxID=1310416 RepID=A0ABV8QVD5_9BACT
MGSLFSIAIIISIFGSCAQIGLPTGGVKDTLAPKLVRASPSYGSVNVTNSKITFEFNEYIDVQDLQQNLLISPLQNRNPIIITNPRSISLKFRDSLLPNTTYNINFGNAIKDINEGNIYQNFTYAFSTGAFIDSNFITGKVILAETGLYDSTLIVMLYTNAVDTTVLKKKPNYIAKVNSDGTFRFNNLPNTTFNIYALKDGDGGKTYNSKAEIFAFANKKINSNSNITLYAYAEQKAIANTITTNAVAGVIRSATEKKLRYNTNLTGAQDLLQPLEITFTNALKNIDTNKIYIADTFYKRLPNVKFSLDSTAKVIRFNTAWSPATPLKLVIAQTAVTDSANVSLTKSDTITFNTKREEDYGRLILRFNDIDLTKNPVIQFVVSDAIKMAFPITSTEFVSKRFPPGDYTVRILYDKNKDGVWTPGNYTQQLQPELVVTLPQKLSIRADWDNEREINL